MKLIGETNLVDLLDLEDADNFVENTLTTEKNNELARRYNNNLRNIYDFIAPLRNARGNLVHGFPATVGELLNLGYTAETLLCDTFGIKYKRAGTAFIEFCGFNPQSLFNLSMYETSGSQLAATRVFNHHKRATDLDGAGRSTTTSRRAAKRHNADARKHNACADSPDYKIIPIHDGRNLVVPGFPTDYEWFLKPHRRDVLYLLGEYGQDIEPEGCLERFEAFARVPEPRGRQKGVEWLL